MIEFQRAAACDDADAEEHSRPSSLQIPSHAQPGDLLQPEGAYRHTEAVFVAADGHGTVRNPDLSASGYLSVPLEISQHFQDPLAKFKELPWMTLELSPHCPWLHQQLGGTPDPQWRLTLFLECVVACIRTESGSQSLPILWAFSGCTYTKLRSCAACGQSIWVNA